LTSREEALKNVQNELQLQKEWSDMFMSFVDGETNKVDIRKLLREQEHLQERINERDVDLVVDSVLNDVLDNDVSELEPRASRPKGNHPQRFGEMVGGGRYDNLPDLDSLSLPNFPAQDYTPICEVVQPEPTLKVPHSQDLLATLLNQTVRPPKQPVPDLSVFDMTEDLPTTNINAEEEVMTIEPSTTGCGMEASKKQVQAADSGNCALQIIVAMAEHDEEEDDELSASDWEGVTVEDFDRLYRLLCSQYKDFHKHHRSSECTIQGLEGEIKSLRSRIEQLQGKIEELKVLDDEELKKLAKTEEVQVLEASMHVLERQLDFERGQWTELHGKYKELMDRFFVLNHWEGVSLANAVQKKLDKYLDEQFHQRVSMEVTKKVSDIMEDLELQKKLAYINVDEEYNNRVSKEAMKRFKDMEEYLMLSGDPNLEITPS
jgi:hypothetical protein